MKQILSKGLEQTAALWSPIAIAYDWVHEAAKILDNEVGLDATLVQLCFQALLNAMSACRGATGYLESGILHFLKVTNSYWPGLFHCHSVPSLPRTNNDLEHIFGRVRHHQRRCTGRKVAPASLVLRGSVQLVASNRYSNQNFSTPAASLYFNPRLAFFAFSVKTASNQSG